MLNRKGAQKNVGVAVNISNESSWNDADNDFVIFHGWKNILFFSTSMDLASLIH